MDYIVDVTGGKGGNAFLVVGREKTALLDCGMAYCASNLIHNIKQHLRQTPLDYILISHSHYDHIGALPYLKQEWPNSIVFGAEYAGKVFNNRAALNIIRELSVQAANYYSASDLKKYDDQMLKLDYVLHEGDTVDLGAVIIRAIETPGHTKCSLSFLMNNETLFPSESTGCMNKSGKMYPAFLTSYSEAIESIRKCQEINPKFIISPHFFGLVPKHYMQDYWRKCFLAAQETKEFILRLADLGCNKEQILAEYEKYFRDEIWQREQPANAFHLNTRKMITAVLECRD